MIDSSHTHAWSDPVYTWSSDHSAVTASRKCSACGEEETETVQAACAITSSPTQTAKGRRTYTSAAFQNSAFAAQKVTLSDIPSLGAMKCLYLPEDLTAIEEDAFKGDASFECVIIPDSCTSIGAGAFSGCGKLIYVRLPKRLQRYAEAAFACCEGVALDYK